MTIVIISIDARHQPWELYDPSNMKSPRGLNVIDDRFGCPTQKGPVVLQAARDHINGAERDFLFDFVEFCPLLLKSEMRTVVTMSVTRDTALTSSSRKIPGEN